MATKRAEMLLKGKKERAEAAVAELSPEALEMAYRKQQRAYRIQDAVRHFEDLKENGSLEEYGICKDASLSEEDANAIVDMFFDASDCNEPENSVFEECVRRVMAQRSVTR